MVSGLAEHVGDMLGDLGAVECKRYFGGTGIWIDGVMVGAVLSGALYLRVSPAESETLCGRGGDPFSYTTRRGTVSVAKMVSVPVDMMEDAPDLVDFVASLSIRNTAPRAR
ncbi:MAG: TfoX/Sxy family protein [Hyphomicrobiales bacterium]